MDLQPAKASDNEEMVIAGPAGALQLRVELPADDRGEALAVICHPHPLFQGTMDNKVVHTLARAVTQLGAPAVRFNFRGVGLSEGVHDDGRGEVDDALAAIDWGVGRWPNRALWLLGFSFGGAIAARAALLRTTARLVTVAPAVRRVKLEVDDRAPSHWLIVQGEDDDIVTEAEVVEWLNQSPPGPELATLAGAGHFFHGQLNELRDIVENFLSRDFSTETPP
jgi:uncharacterized protein